MPWMGIVLGIGGTFCLLRGVMDLRQRRYVWGALGITIGLALLSTPFQTHAIKFDLPAPSQR